MPRDNEFNNTCRSEQAKALFGSAYTSNAGMIAAALIVYFILKYYEQEQYVVLLAPAVILVCLIRILISWLFSHSSKKEEEPKAVGDEVKFLNAYTVLTLLLGLTWATLMLLHHDILDNETETFITVILIGLIAASSGTLSYWIPAFLAIILPVGASLVSFYVIKENYFIATGIMVFVGVMVSVALRANSNFRYNFMLLAQNQELMDEMRSHQEQLEDEVKKRTNELLVKNRDLSEQVERRQQIEKELENLAYYDVLTGLPNRSLLIDRLEKAITIAHREDKLIGVLFIDLDRFKNFNDSLGHDFGDAILTEVASRLKKLLRESDTVARNGGDEFVVIIEDAHELREIFIVAEKIVHSITTTFMIDNHAVHIGASIGVALYPLDDSDPHELLKMADTAMYCAKKDGGDCFEFYSKSMSNQIKDRMELENRLHHALANESFHLVFQPKVNCISGETVGFEALLRWHDETLGDVSPERFVPVLEESGLIYKVGEWIIEEAVRFIASGKIGDRTISVNLSALQCFVTGLGARISEIIHAHGIRPEQMEFELTETVLVSNFEKAERFLDDINALGCSIALDDFGTGYTSMAYLARLPIDIIKIDRSFVSGIQNNENLIKIVRAIVTMSQSLGISNVFEGVETEAELNEIKKLNGSVIQGYYYSEPLNCDEVDEWLQRNLSEVRHV